MARGTRQLLIVALGCAAALHASQNPQKILSDSAWCKHADGFIGTLDEDPHSYAVKGPNAKDIGLQGPSSSADWFPVGKMPSTHMPSLPVTVRWDSAQPIREALLAIHSKDSTDSEHSLSSPEKYYIVTVIGLATQQKSSASAADDRVEQTRLRQSLVNQSRLMIHGKDAIVPVDARVDPESGEIHLYFPRDRAITVKDKEVTFGTVFGSVRVMQRFKLKDMVYGGQLSL